jgi:hypothetical protein
VCSNTIGEQSQGVCTPSLAGLRQHTNMKEAQSAAFAVAAVFNFAAHAL